MRNFFGFLLTLCLFYPAASQSYQYYFGNLHAHTAFSDGNKDSVSSGVSTPAGSYAYAKLSDDFDFLGISEHNHYSSLRNPGFKLPLYQQGLNMAQAANADGSFVALFGMEYGISSGNNGHVLIYGFDQLIGWETSGAGVNIPGVTGNNYQVFNGKTDYEGLFRKVKNNPNAFAYLAHPYWTDFSLDGSNSTALAFSPYNAMFDSAIVGMPLRSGNAFSTFTDYSDYAPGHFFDYYKKMLHNGYHLGIGYDHDNHNTNFGRGNGGRLVLVMPALTHSNVMTAMKNMNFYGSDDSNAQLWFNVGGNIMGSVFSGTTFPQINIIHNDPDGELADTIRLWKGFRNKTGLWADVINISYKTNALSYTDFDLQAGIEYYYFAEIRQADGQWMVSSPVWYSSSGIVSVPEKENHDLHETVIFPNPTDGSLSMSFPTQNVREVLIINITGVVVKKFFTSEKNLYTNLSGISPGIYQLIIKEGNRAVSKRLIVR